MSNQTSAPADPCEAALRQVDRDKEAFADQEREADRVAQEQAAVTLGAGMGHIMRRHVIPNVAPSLIVLSTSWIGIAALWIAGLGFLGLGVQPPSPEWGAILNEGANYITIAWWITVFPGTILALYVVGMNLVGDGLRDQLDPTVSRR